MNSAVRGARIARWVLPSVVVLLLALLGVRVIVGRTLKVAWRGPSAAATVAKVPSIAPSRAPAAKVPPPRRLTLADIPEPVRWTNQSASDKLPRLDFSIDLDYFAPLGDGPANVAVWFRDFAWSDGSRAEDVRGLKKTVRYLGEDAGAYDADAPLVREAAPWVDQAICRFYPDIWNPQGLNTRLPNLIFTMNLAKAWAARGATESNPEMAKDDYRRAIRLGRLFMQDDMSMVHHLIGWACVSTGLRGLNELARREGDAVMVAATTLALGDYTAMRSLASEWLTDMRPESALKETWWGWSPSIDGPHLDRIVAHARNNPLRCLRTEAFVPLYVIKHEGTRAQREKAAEVLADLSHNSDPRIASYASWFEQHPYDRTEFFGTRRD